MRPQKEKIKTINPEPHNNAPHLPHQDDVLLLWHPRATIRKLVGEDRLHLGMNFRSGHRQLLALAQIQTHVPMEVSGPHKKDDMRELPLGTCWKPFLVVEVVLHQRLQAGEELDALLAGFVFLQAELVCFFYGLW